MEYFVGGGAIIFEGGGAFFWRWSDIFWSWCTIFGGAALFLELLQKFFGGGANGEN